MKKSFMTLLVLVFMLSIAGTALAESANPFADVPKSHWAYSAVDQLAKAGIVDGYGDSSFRGDRTITRYEMAQIIAKAMARSDKADAANKALIDKLAVEFANELNNLGVRISKLEEKTKVALTYESRIRYSGDDNKASDKQATNAFDFRQRINFKGAVNDKVEFGARLATSDTAFGSGSFASVGFDRMYFNIKGAFFDQMTLGRFSTCGTTNGLLNAKSGNNDGVKVVSALSDAVKFTGLVVDVKPYSTAGGGGSEVGLANLEIKAGNNTNFNIGYQTSNLTNVSDWPLKGNTTSIKADSLDIGAYTKLGDFYLTGEYVNTKVKDLNGSDPNLTAKAYAIQLTNGIVPYFYPTQGNIVDPKKAHTDAFAISYRKMDANSVPYTSAFTSGNPFATDVNGQTSGRLSQDDNVKGFYFAYQNVLSQGLVFNAEYQDIKQIEGEGKDKVYNMSLQFFF